MPVEGGGKREGGLCDRMKKGEPIFGFNVFELVRINTNPPYIGVPRNLFRDGLKVKSRELGGQNFEKWYFQALKTTFFGGSISNFES